MTNPYKVIDAGTADWLKTTLEDLWEYELRGRDWEGYLPREAAEATMERIKDILLTDGAERIGNERG